MKGKPWKAVILDRDGVQSFLESRGILGFRPNRISRSGRHPGSGREPRMETWSEVT
jgi:hypothetical protein